MESMTKKAEGILIVGDGSFLEEVRSILIDFSRFQYNLVHMDDSPTVNTDRCFRELSVGKDDGVAICTFPSIIFLDVG
jgi:hypothetical protein